MNQDPTYQFRQALYTALNENISYNNVYYQIELYETLQKADKYIKIGYPLLIDNSDAKDIYLMHGTINIEVVNMRYTQAHSAEQEMNDIINDINLLIVNQSLSMDDFTLAVGLFVTGYTTEETMDIEAHNENTIKKIITYEFQIQQDD